MYVKQTESFGRELLIVWTEILTRVTCVLRRDFTRVCTPNACIYQKRQSCPSKEIVWPSKTDVNFGLLPITVLDSYNFSQNTYIFTKLYFCA